MKMITCSILLLSMCCFYSCLKKNPGPAAGVPRNAPDRYFAYVSSTSSDEVRGYEINTDTGALTHLSTTTVAKAHKLALNPNNSCLYVTQALANKVSSFSINRSTGALTLVTQDFFCPG